MNKRSRAGRELSIRISSGPCCPSCGETGFDDWHLDPSMHVGAAGLIEVEGRLRCHGCSRFFHVTRYKDGTVHSCMWRKPKLFSRGEVLRRAGVLPVPACET